MAARSISLAQGFLITVLFVLFDEALARVLSAAGLRFPSSVAGMLLVFAAMTAFSRFRPVAAGRVEVFCAPAVRFLGRWMALFFVPPLVVLPAAELPLEDDLWKMAVIITAGFVFTLITTALLVMAFSRDRKFDLESDRPVVVRRMPFRTLVAGWVLLLLASGFLWVVGGSELAASVTLLSVTVVGFLAGMYAQGWSGPGRNDKKRRFTWQRAALSIVHPVVTGALAAIAAIEVTGYTYSRYLRGEGLGTAPGDILMMLLNPAVVALGFLLYRERKLLFGNAREILSSLIIASFLSLFSSAAGAWLLGMSTRYALAVIPRSVTTPIAIPIAEILGANPGMVAALVVLTGVLGAVFGQSILDALGFSQPVIRGVAIGASSHGIGTAALVNTEPSSAAVSGVSFALMAAFSAAAVSIPYVFELLLALV